MRIAWGMASSKVFSRSRKTVAVGRWLICVSCAHSVDESEYMRVEGSHAPLQSGEHHSLGWAVQEMREMGLSLVGSLGFGMGWMSASFHTGGRQPANQDALSMASRAVSPAGPACVSIEYVKPSAPAAVSRPFFLVLVSSCRVKSWSVTSAISHASLTASSRCSQSCCWRWRV